MADPSSSGGILASLTADLQSVAGSTAAGLGQAIQDRLTGKAHVAANAQTGTPPAPPPATKAAVAGSVSSQSQIVLIGAAVALVLLVAFQALGRLRGGR